ATCARATAAWARATGSLGRGAGRGGGEGAPPRLPRPRPPRASQTAASPRTPPARAGSAEVAAAGPPPRHARRVLVRLRSSAAAALWTLVALAVSLPVRAEPPVPAPQGFVTDLAGVISPPMRARITRLAQELRDK